MWCHLCCTSIRRSRGRLVGTQIDCPICFVRVIAAYQIAERQAKQQEQCRNWWDGQDNTEGTAGSAGRAGQVAAGIHCQVCMMPSHLQQLDSHKSHAESAVLCGQVRVKDIHLLGMTYCLDVAVGSWTPCS